MDYGSNPKLPGSHFSIRQVILTVQYIGIDMPEEEQRGDSWWLWCHTCYWHCTIAANEDFGEKLERDVVDSPEAVLSLLFVLLTITGLGWKGAWLELQHTVCCTLGSWCVTTQHAELTVHAIKACFWITDSSNALHHFKCPENPLHFFFLVGKVWLLPG